MRTRYGTPAWGQDVPSSRVPSFSRYRGEQTADVVVIGGGLTGSVAAYLCAAAGLQTILLEGDRIGLGRTLRSAGVMSPEPGPPFRAVVERHGLRSARAIFEMWRRGALDGAALLRRLGVKCDLEPRESLIVAAAQDERELRREHDARRDAGLDLAWLTRKQLQARMKLDGAAGGLKARDGFTLDPYRACIGVAAAAAGAGATCHERSAVKKVRFTRKFADVFADGGRIRTTRVIVATGGVTDLYRQLRRHLDDRETYIVMTDRMPAAMRKQLGDPRVVMRDVQNPPTQVGLFGDRLLIAGGDQAAVPPRKREPVLVQRTGQLMYDVLKMYPAISGLQPAHGWASPYGLTADGLMYIGAHRNYPHHLFAVGGASSSVTGSFVAGRILLRAVQGEPDKADEALGWTR